MTVDEFNAKYRNRMSPPIKSSGIKSRLDLITFSQLDDDAYSKGMHDKDTWIDIVSGIPYINLTDSECNYHLGQFIGYNNIDWISDDELDKLLDVVKESLEGRYNKLGKVIAYFGGIQGKDHYWLTDLCKNNRFTQKELERFYVAGTDANLDREFEILDEELAHDY